MARICGSHLNQRYGPVTAVRDLTGTVQRSKLTGFRGPNGVGESAAVWMPVESSRPTPGTPIIDGLTCPPIAQASGVINDSAVSESCRTGRDTPRGHDTSSPALSQRVTRLGLAATAVLIFMVAVAAAVLAAHGWSHMVQQLGNALGYLPQPVRALIGGRLARLLN